MSCNNLFSFALHGLASFLVEVECDTSPGLPSFQIVGLTDKSIEESKERVKSAIRNSGFKFPKNRVVVNLAPAHLKKFGSHYDLVIAVSVLIRTKQLKQHVDFKKSVFCGELGLDGRVRSVTGILSMVSEAKKQGFNKAFVPYTNYEEALLVEGIDIYPVKNLKEIFLVFNSKFKIENSKKDKKISSSKVVVDMKDIAGQVLAKRAALIAACGGHSLLLCGSPGSGKTLLAKSLASILPPLTNEEALEVTKIYSVANKLSGKSGLLKERPFRAPHHSASAASIVGGGRIPLPGEVTLAHRGILFLDEFPEFPRYVLDQLREPLEDGSIHISRVMGGVRYPCQFSLVAAMNPCPCGYYSDLERECTCQLSQVVKYKSKISGPLIDRIDLFVDVPRVKFDELYHHKEEASSSSSLKKIVSSVREIQSNRFSQESIFVNAEMNQQLIKKYCALDEKTLSVFKNFSDKLKISARVSMKLLKVSRTIADMEGSDTILENHLLEAFQYRSKI